MKHQTTIQSLPELMHTLADQLRLRLLRVLEMEELAVGEIARVVQSPQSTVSRHLKLLSEAGWLAKRSLGPATQYRLVLDDLPPAQRGLWTATRDAFAAGAADQPGYDQPEYDEDLRRLASVIAERREDSVGFFGRLAGEWDDLRGGLFGSAFTTEGLLSLIPPDWAIADLGCGTGNAAERVAPCVERVIAVDQAEPMLDATRKRLAHHENLECVLGKLERLPMDDGAVDATLCFLVLHHLADPVPALSEMRRVLRAERGGGIALVVDMLRHGREEYRRDLGHRHLGFTTAEITRAFHDAGFAGVRVRELPPDPQAEGPGLFAAVGVVEGSAWGAAAGLARTDAARTSGPSGK